MTQPLMLLIAFACNGPANEDSGGEPHTDSEAGLEDSGEVGGDCNDLDSGVYPGATEICDGQQNDCDLDFWDESGMAEWADKGGERVDVSDVWVAGGEAFDVTLDTEGSLFLCEGTYSAHIEITADVDIRGYGAVLSGGNDGVVVTARTAGTSVWLTGLELRDGFGLIEPDMASTGGYTAGGGVYCQGATIQIDGTIFQDNDAIGYGAGLFAEDCVVELNDVTFDGNAVSAGRGGAMTLDGSVTTVQSALFSSSSSRYDGNHVYLYGDGALTIEDAAFDSGDTRTIYTRSSDLNEVVLRDVLVDASAGVVKLYDGTLELDGVESIGGTGPFGCSECTSMVVTDSTFAGCTRSCIEVEEAGSFELSGSTFEDNASTLHSGPVYVYDTPTTITDTVFTTTSGEGSALYLESLEDKATIDSCAFSDNTAEMGAIHVNTGEVEVIDSDFTGNTLDMGTDAGDYTWGEGASFTCTAEGACD
ncbi:MAG: hypothetical protein GY884_16040 [Proteobacteria bacterium]|nr:hypothetical protein [Pseudomonadota bacterium]